MSLLPEEFQRRANLALQAFQGSTLPPVVAAEVDAFFAKYVSLERTKTAELFITTLILERLSATAAEPQPAAQPLEKKTA